LGCFLYHHNIPPLHFVIWCECMVFEGFFKHTKIWKSHRNKARLYAGFMNSSHCVAFSWSCTLWATCSRHCDAGWCPSVSLPRHLFLILVCRFWTIRLTLLVMIK
jgi:hypothetical protein